MTKLQLQNLAWTSTSKSWPNLETLYSKSEQKLNFKTKLHFPNLHQTVVNTFLTINMSNSNNLNKFELSSSHARVTSIKFTKQQWVSESVSESVSDKHFQWSESGPIKIQRIIWIVVTIGNATAQILGTNNDWQPHWRGTQKVKNEKYSFLLKSPNSLCSSNIYLYSLFPTYYNGHS